MQGTMPGARKRGRPRTAWVENIKTWTGLPVEESIRMTEDKDKWRKYVHGVANLRIEAAAEQNGTARDTTTTSRQSIGADFFPSYKNEKSPLT